MSVEKKLRLKSCNFLRNQNFSTCVCFIMNQSPTVLDNLNEEDASGLFCGFYGKCYFLKVVFLNVSWCVWIIFCLNWKTFFFFVYMLSLNLPLQILQSGVFPNEPLIWFAILVADLRIILPHSRYSEQVCSIVSGLLFSFDEKLRKNLLSCAGEMSVVLIFDICNVYEIVAYDLVKMVDMTSKLLGSTEDWCLFLACHLGWFGSLKWQN